MNKYESIARQALKDVEKRLGHEIAVKYWKSNRPYSGLAQCKTYTITVPEPKSDISLNTFLHELGHLIHQVKPSCLNEYLASRFALDSMRKYGLSISRKVKRHHNWYIAYSLAQALNRKLKTVPTELKPFRKYLSMRKVYNTTVINTTVIYQYYADLAEKAGVLWMNAEYWQYNYFEIPTEFVKQNQLKYAQAPFDAYLEVEPKGAGFTINDWSSFTLPQGEETRLAVKEFFEKI